MIIIIFATRGAFWMFFFSSSFYFFLWNVCNGTAIVAGVGSWGFSYCNGSWVFAERDKNGITALMKAAVVQWLFEALKLLSAGCPLCIWKRYGGYLEKVQISAESRV